MASKSRISRKFIELRARNESALIPFIVCGDPSLEDTAALVETFEAAGADMLELGVPFSDPMADGPANQRALARGLAAGVSVDSIIGLVRELRRRTEIPLILFGYYNPFFHYGCERLCRDAASAGVDGLLVVDLPPEESAELARPARAHNLDLIRLLAPTTPLERCRAIARAASGFLYYVSVTGVTGARAVLPADLEPRLQELRGITSLPLGVGFGISTPQQACAVASFADAVVVGSAISSVLEQHGHGAFAWSAAGELVGAMKRAMRTARTATAPAA
jgi:tryptophan synthase alpha chain